MVWKQFILSYLMLVSLHPKTASENISLFLSSFGSPDPDHVYYDRSNPSCSFLKSSQREECKFYGECCRDVVRIRERLEPDTYQCMNIGNTQGYVVNRCPTGTADELKDLCAGSQDRQSLADEMNLKTWPVTGSYTGVTYRNLYCAICNAALQPVLEHVVTPFDPLKALEFWTMNVYCTNDTLDLIETEEFSVSSLQTLLNKGDCWSEFRVTEHGIHNKDCGNYIRKCPDDFSNIEIRSLCEDGPVDKFQPPYLNITFRNKFCWRCWKDREISEPLISTDNAADNGGMLMTVRPVQQRRLEDSFSNQNLKKHQRFTAVYLSFTNNISEWYFSDPVLLDSDDSEQIFWDLGSLLCFGNYSKVCGQFLVFPPEDEGGLCSGPGCGYNQVQDLTGSCFKLATYQYNQSITLNRKFKWANSEIGKYISICKHGDAKNCKCDSRCYYLGDCCSDADVPETKPKHLMRWTCHKMYKVCSSNGIVVVNSCPPDATDLETNLCAYGEVGEWGTYGWLVTDTNTLLTYKNLYCAQCNMAANLSYWDVYVSCSSDAWSGNITGECSFLTYAPPSDNSNFFYACPLSKKYVSTCPEMYSDWRLSKDCETGHVSYVYHNNTIFRNYFCAICNLGDDMEYVDIFPDWKNFEKDLSKYIPILQQKHGQNIIRVSPKSWLCCGRCLYEYYDQCSDINNGSSLLPEFFNSMSSSSHVNDTEDLDLKPTLHPDIDMLCGHTVLACNSSRPQYARSSDHIICYQIPSVSQMMFSPNIIPEQTRDETSVLRESNDTFLFCPNKTIISKPLGEIPTKILLSKTGIWVEYRESSEDGRQGMQQLTYPDYILIGSSLSAIVTYLLFYAIKKGRSMHLPDLMMITLLLCLFGALICFALINVPVGKDVIGCKALAAITQFFFLSSLMWSNSIAISIMRSISTMRLVSRSLKPFKLYCLYSFGIPLICVIITFVLSVTGLPFSDDVYGEKDICFLHKAIVRYSLFLIPIYILIAANIIIGILVMYKVSRGGGVGTSQDKNRIQKNIITCFKVSTCLGIGWVLLFVATIHDGVMWRVVQVFIELQGLLVVLANVLSWSCVTSIKVRVSSLTTQTAKIRTDSSKTASLPSPSDESIPLKS